MTIPDTNHQCCDENCKLRPNAKCSDKNSPCCISCNFMAQGSKCRSDNYATCEEKAVCTGNQAACPASRPMADDTECNERGKCKNGQCIPYCETQHLQVHSHVEKRCLTYYLGS